MHRLGHLAPLAGRGRSDSFRFNLSLSVGAANHIHEFGDLAALIGLVAGGDRMLDAMGDVVAQDFLLDQRRGTESPIRRPSPAPAQDSGGHLRPKQGRKV